MLFIFHARLQSLAQLTIQKKLNRSKTLWTTKHLADAFLDLPHVQKAALFSVNAGVINITVQLSQVAVGLLYFSNQMDAVHVSI